MVVCHYCLGRPSLKELCPDDKRRVRQLIEELARVSSEKETAEERLRGERKAFQEILLQLRSEHREVLKEKQGILCTVQCVVSICAEQVNNYTAVGTGLAISGPLSPPPPHI